MTDTCCSIEGCKGRTSRCFPWICSKHWRTACPPGSKERKALNRICRLGKRYGWSDTLSNRFWVIWNTIVRRGNARVRGDLDVAEINRLMGWDDPPAPSRSERRRASR